MKKIILSAALLASSLMASNITANTKDMMEALKTSLPSTYEIFDDYYQAKTCKADYHNLINIKDFEDFGADRRFGVLVGLKAIDTPESKEKYDSLIEGYRFLNCGSKDDYKKIMSISQGYLDQKQQSDNKGK